MCYSDFCKILVGDDDYRMIMCREEDFDRRKIRKVIQRAFPELFPGLKKFFSRVRFRVEHCYKMYPSSFDSRIGPLEAEHDWDKSPFVALLVCKEGGKAFCKATPVPGF